MAHRRKSNLYQEIHQGWYLARWQTNQRKQKQTARDRARVAEALSEIAITTDAHWQITTWNHAAETMLGWKAVETQGLHALDLLKIETNFFTDPMTARKVFQKTPWSGQARITRRDGELLDVQISITQLTGQTDTGMLLVCRNIAEEISASRTTQERLQTLVEFSQDIIMFMDTTRTFHYINPACSEYLGKVPAEILGRRSDDLFSIEISAKLALIENQVLVSGQPAHIDIQVPGAAETRWFNVSFNPIFNSGACCDGLSIIARDITLRKKLEEDLRTSESQFRAILEQRDEAIIFTNPSGKIIYANRVAETLANSPVGGLANWALEDFFHLEHLAFLDGSMDQLHRGVSISVDVRANLPNGMRDLFVTATPHYDGQGHWVGALFSIRDITEQKRAEERLRYDATHDALTGLFNRQYYNEQLAFYQNAGQFPLSVMILDIDSLKSINDRWGHENGDQLLQCAARVIRRATRQADMVARIGGDEFIILLPNTSQEQAATVMSRMAQEIILENSSGMNLFQISLSAGISTAEEPGSLGQVVSMADSHMYQVKNAKKGEALLYNPRPAHIFAE